MAVLSLATTRSLLKQLRVGSGKGLDLVALKDCFNSAHYRRLGTHLPEEVARNTGCEDYSVSYPFLVSRYLMVPGLNVESWHLWLDPPSAYLLFAGINSAELIGRRGLDPDHGIIGEESHHTLYVMSVPRSVEVLHHGHGVCHRAFPPPSRLEPAGHPFPPKEHDATSRSPERTSENPMKAKFTEDPF